MEGDVPKVDVVAAPVGVTVSEDKNVNAVTLKRIDTVPVA